MAWRIGAHAPPRRTKDEEETDETINFCEANITLTHGSAGDKVLVRIWLPLLAEDWNGRFQGTGGGGFVAGGTTDMLIPAIGNGYAAGTTNAGLSLSSGEELLNNTQLMTNFASLSIHEMTVVGKAITKAYFKQPAKFSYWNGCSTGGRQGMMEAQRYPDDYDGILAIAPAINWARFIPAELYPYITMIQNHGPVPACVFDALTAAQIAACDLDDGAADGILADPSACVFDAHTVVGQATTCQDAGHATIGSDAATVFNAIFEGFVSQNGTQLWYGLSPGTPVTSLAAQPPFFIAQIWVVNFVLSQQGRDPATLTYADLEEAFAVSQTQFSSIIGTEDPNLARVRDSGRKIITWHGLADELIFPNGTLDYRRRVEAALGGAAAVDEFYRVFEAPGVGHCRGGNGPIPHAQVVLDVLAAWVEHGVPPDTLPAYVTEGDVTNTRNLCRYPLKQKYLGTGDMHDAESWTCI
ncbi:tannase and feruloyl esterase [Thozetella sp. PMI_491]|nr:tannase and feruloyl esterase [Thozetella sp. PMI_491]